MTSPGKNHIGRIDPEPVIKHFIHRNKYDPKENTTRHCVVSSLGIAASEIGGYIAMWSKFPWLAAILVSLVTVVEFISEAGEFQ